MSKNKKTPNFSLALVAICAILSALSIVFGKYLAINIGDSYRLSFENLPIFLAGIFIGPFAGATVGIVADLVGCILVGYAINPIITFGAATIGFLSGILSKQVKKENYCKILFAVFPAHLIGSVIIKTLGLWIYYGSPFFATLLIRLFLYLFCGTLEFFLLYGLIRNKAFTKQIHLLLHKNH